MISSHIKKQIIALFLFFVLLVALAPSLYFYNKYQQTRKLVKSSSTAKETENVVLLKKIGTHVLLPSDEDPTFATITNKDELKDQHFFDPAQNGDKVVVFKVAKKAYIYRPATDKVIAMGPIASEQSSQSATLNGASAKPAAPEPVRVAILNGTKAPGLALRTEDLLIAAFKDTIKVVSKGNSVKDYDKTIVISINSTGAKIAQNIAKSLNATIEKNVPASELKPSADILIIVAQ